MTIGGFESKTLSISLDLENYQTNRVGFISTFPLVVYSHKNVNLIARFYDIGTKYIRHK